MSYIAMVTKKADFDRFADDRAVIDGDVEDFIAEAEYNDITLEQLLINAYLRYGEEHVTLVDELTPGTDYCLYAYGMNEAGEATTGLEKVQFRTLEVDRVEIDFDIRVTERTATSMSVEIDADPASCAYFFSILSEAAYSGFDDVQEAVAARVAEVVRYHKDRGFNVSQIYKGLASFGSDGDKFDVVPGAKYYVFAVGIDEEFLPNSTAAVLEVPALEAASSDNTFTVRIDAVTYCGIEGSITTTNDDPYIWCIQSKEDVDLCADDDEIMNKIAAVYSDYGILDQLLHNGPSKIEQTSSLNPDSDYYLLVFGWDQAPTTQLVKEAFHTDKAETDASKLTVEFIISDVSYDNATVQAVPNCGVYYFMGLTEADRFEGMAEEMGRDKACVELLNNEAFDWMDEDWGWGMSPQEAALQMGSIGPVRRTYEYQLDPETRYIAFAISLNMETCEAGCEKGFVSEVFTTLTRPVSNAAVTFTAGKYYDGDELAEIDPDKYGILAGRAILHYTLEPNAEAAHWYTNFYNGDYSEYGDDYLRMVLVDFGYENPYESNPDNVEFDSRGGYYVLPYDKVFSFCSMAKDADDAFGPSYVELVMLTRAGASPGSEFPELNTAETLRCPAEKASLPERLRRPLRPTRGR